MNFSKNYERKENMNYKVATTDYFELHFRRLSKKYRSLIDDLETFKKEIRHLKEINGII